MNIRNVILIVLNNFTNDNRVLKEAVTLKAAGYSVVVLAMHDDNLLIKENKEGIDIERIKLTSKKLPRIIFFQIIKYFEFVFLCSKKIKHESIVHCNDLDALIIGVINKKILKKNIKILYDAHEYETETINLSGIRKKAVKIAESITIRSADTVITVSDTIAKEYKRIYGIKLPDVVLNAPRYINEIKSNRLRSEFEIPLDKKIFLYQGLLGRGRGIETILEAFSNPEIRNAVIVFLGYGELESLIKQYSKDNVNIFFHEAVPIELLSEYTASADFGIAIIQPICLSYEYCLPNKVFEYIMAGIPIIVSDLIELKKVINENKIGFVIKDNSTSGLIETVKRALGAEYLALKSNLVKVKKKYSWEEQETILNKIFSGLN